MSQVKKVFIFWLPVVLWMGLIYGLSSFHQLQASPIGWQDFILRKSAHFLEYTLLYFLFYRAIRNTTRLTFSQIIVLSLSLTILYSLTDEYHQTLVVGRSGRRYDVLVDSLGGVFGMCLALTSLPRLPKKIKFWAKKLGLL